MISKEIVIMIEATKPLKEYLLQDLPYALYHLKGTFEIISKIPT